MVGNVFGRANHFLAAAFAKYQPRNRANSHERLHRLADGALAFLRLDVDEGVHLAIQVMALSPPASVVSIPPLGSQWLQRRKYR